jgi:NodT family efflux transporter outer membrane factor (OMF) lipoprotein
MYNMRPMKALATLLLATVAALSGCAVSSAYQVPSVPVPAAFSTGDGSPAADLSAWWTAFGDPTLASLVTRALTSNLDVAQARARVRQARAQERVTRGGQGPQLDASGSAATNHLSKNALPAALAGLGSGGSGSAGSGAGLGLPGESFNTFQAGFDASWELDLFGGDARAVEAVRARSVAADWSLRDAQVVLAAEVASNYQQLRALQRRLALADAALATQRDVLAFTQVRVRHGLAAAPDALRQQRAVDQSSAQRDDLAGQVEITRHALAALLGLAPTALAGELATPAAAAPVLVDVPPGLPSDLLRRRPDIRAAERQLAAASADVGVATADLYPRITLTGALQLASRSLTNLISADSRQDSLSARVAFPLLGRDRLHAAVDLRQARADEAALAYRKTVLGALRDVEDALTRLDASRHRLAELQSAAHAAQDEAEAAATLYRNGLTPAPDMLAARQAWQAAQDVELQASAASAQDVVALYKALGGGWDPRREPIEEDAPRGQGH